MDRVFIHMHIHWAHLHRVSSEPNCSGSQARSLAWSICWVFWLNILSTKKIFKIESTFAKRQCIARTRYAAICEYHDHAAASYPGRTLRIRRQTNEQFVVCNLICFHHHWMPVITKALQAVIQPTIWILRSFKSQRQSAQLLSFSTCKKCRSLPYMLEAMPTGWNMNLHDFDR